MPRAVRESEGLGKWRFGPAKLCDRLTGADDLLADTTTHFGSHLRLDLERGWRDSIAPEAAEGEPEYRFSWTTPIQLSPYDPQVLFAGAQMVLRSSDRGETWEETSPDLTTNDPEKIDGEGYIQYCTITSLAQSPLDRRRIWAGTDDGRVWSTSDEVASWIEHSVALAAAGAPAERWVSRVVPSRHRAERAYVSQSGYRRDDFRPFLYRGRGNRGRGNRARAPGGRAGRGRRRRAGGRRRATPARAPRGGPRDARDAVTREREIGPWAADHSRDARRAVAGAAPPSPPAPARSSILDA